MLEVTIRAAALAATLDALHKRFAQGRALGDPVQAELLMIAREQAAAMLGRRSDDARRQLSPTVPRAAVASGLVIPFRRQAKMSSSVSS